MPRYPRKLGDPIPTFRPDQAPEDTDECECGHVLDEHNPQTQACTIDDCYCIHFDKKEAE